MHEPDPIELWPVEPDDVEAAWSLVGRDVRDACAESDGELDADLVQAALGIGEAVLWMVVEGDAYHGVVVAEATRTGFCNVILLRLSPRAPRLALRTVLDQLHELTGLRLAAWSRRPGMARLLGRLGWKPRFVEFLQPVEG